MANVVNERDLLLQNATTRTSTVTLPGSVLLPALKAVTLSAPGTSFRVATDGSSSPSAITLTANLRAISGTPIMTWSVTPAGAATLTGSTYGVRTLTYANMAQDYCTVRVEVNDGGMIYFDELSFAKVRDGSKGVDGRRGSISTARAVTGSSWSDAQALQALADLGVTTPLATDTVTLYNASANYAEMRRYDGTGWVAVASSMPGSVLMNGSIVTEKLLVTGLGIALNPDPNTQDISAWTGTGLSIVTDTTSPSGSSALECAGLGATVLSKKFPIDPTKNYKARLWTRQQYGSSTSYLVVAFYDASGTVISGTSNGTGWPGKGTYHYFGLVNAALPAAWTEYSVSFGPNEAAVLPSNARFAAIGAVSNFTGTGVQRIAAALVHLKTTGDMVVDGTLTASKIDTRGLSIKDAAGNVILAAGNPLDWGMVGGSGKPENNATVGAPNGTYVGGTLAQTVAAGAANGTSSLSAINDSASGLATKIASNARNVFSGSGGLAVGSITWDSVGNYSNGSGIAITSKGIAAVNAGVAKFYLDTAGNAAFAGTLSAAAGTFSGTLTADAINAVNTINIAGNAVTVPIACSGGIGSRFPSNGVTTATVGGGSQITLGLFESAAMTFTDSSGAVSVVFSAQCSTESYGGGCRCGVIARLVNTATGSTVGTFFNQWTSISGGWTVILSATGKVNIPAAGTYKVVFDMGNNWSAGGWELVSNAGAIVMGVKR